MCCKSILYPCFIFYQVLVCKKYLLISKSNRTQSKVVKLLLVAYLFSQWFSLVGARTVGVTVLCIGRVMSLVCGRIVPIGRLPCIQCQTGTGAVVFAHPTQVLPAATLLSQFVPGDIVALVTLSVRFECNSPAWRMVISVITYQGPFENDNRQSCHQFITVTCVRKCGASLIHFVFQPWSNY